MRKLLLLALLIGSSTIAIAQDTYYILAVKGKILNRNSNQYLKARQKIKSSDKVIFKDKNAKALIYSRGKGRFNLTLSPQNKKSPNELVVLVKKSIFAQQQGAFTRAIITSLKDLREYINMTLVDDKIKKRLKNPQLIGLDNRLELNFVNDAPRQVKQLGKGLFFIRYQYEGKTRNVGLAYKDNKLIITKESLFKTKDGKWLDPSKASDMHLGFYKQEAPKGIVQLGDKNGTTKLMLNLLFFSNQELTEMGLFELINTLKKDGVKDEKIIYEIGGFLFEFGVANKQDVTDWYNQNFK